MDRRAFLRQLGFGTVSAAAAALTWDVERLLWVPGEKATIFLPRQMLYTPDEIMRENARILREAVRRLADAIDVRCEFDADLFARIWAQSDVRPPLQIQRPQRFSVGIAD